MQGPPARPRGVIRGDAVTVSSETRASGSVHTRRSVCSLGPSVQATTPWKENEKFIPLCGIQIIWMFKMGKTTCLDYVLCARTVGDRRSREKEKNQDY